MAVQPIQIFHRVADHEARMQIEKKMHIAQRPREIKQHYVLSRVRGQLHAQIYGDGGRARRRLSIPSR